MKKNILLVSLLALVLSVTSCQDFLDINTDPNSPASANITTSMILPGVEMALATSYGDYYRITGGYFSQIYSHMFGTSNYIDYSQFQMSGTRSNTHYTQLYQKVLVNCKDIKAKAEAEEDWNTYLAAVAYSAFAYQILVDCYGDVPYTEALDDTNLAPKYDDGEVVYKGIVAELDAALAKATEGQKIASNFLYPSGNSSDWIKFANSVKLRILMRMSNAVDVKSQLASLVAENNFITSDAQYVGCWSNAQSAANPLYSEEYAAWHSQSNVAANVAIINTMIIKDEFGNVTYQDPRVSAYFAKNSSGAYVGGISGTNFGASAPAPYNSAAGLSRPIVEYNTPVDLISVAEVEFFLAEYYARYGSAADAKAHFENAIKASFAQAGVSGADECIAKFPYDNANYAKSIGVAKWVALSGSNTFEAWCEVRRLKYPAFGSVSGSDMWNGSNAVNVSDYVAGTLYTPYQVFGQVGNNNLLQRWPVANASESRNSNAPDFKGYSTPVFWAK